MPRIHKPLIVQRYLAEVAVVKGEIVIEGTADGQANDVGSASDAPLGVALHDAAAGEQLEVCLAGACDVLAGGTFARGDLLEADANGKAIKITIGATTGDLNVLGKALEAGASGSMSSVLIAANHYCAE